MVQPLVRGTFTKFLWRSAKCLDGRLGERLREGFPAELRQRIREVPRLGWAEASLLVETCDAVRAIGGPEACFAMWHRCCTDCVDLPLVRPLAQGAVTLFGAIPSALVRRTPQLWQLVTRECGSMQAEEEDRSSMRFDARGLPPVLCSEGLLPMFEAGFRAQLDVLGYEGDVQVDATGLAEGQVACQIRWGRQTDRPSPRVLSMHPSA